MKQILAIDKNENNFERHKSTWLKYGMTPVRVESMQEALENIYKNEYVFIGINSDCINYKSCLKIMRDITLSPICVFSSNHSFDEYIEAVELGADYYVQRQEDSEQTTRLNQVIIQRYLERQERIKKLPKFYSYKGVFVCPHYHKVFIADKEIKLTRKEFELLCLLVSSPKQVFTNEQILKRVWGDDYIDSETSAVRNVILRLRKKINFNSKSSIQFIKTIFDVGYVFDR